MKFEGIKIKNMHVDHTQLNGTDGGEAAQKTDLLRVHPLTPSECFERVEPVLLHDYLGVETIADETLSRGGIIIPAQLQQNKRILWGRVVCTGEKIATGIEVGDRVLFDKNYSYRIFINDREIEVFKEVFAVMVLKEKRDGERK